MKLTYDEVSPMTNNLSVLVEYDEHHGWNKICMESGYCTYQGWIVGSPEVEAFEFVSTPHIKNTRYVDKNDQVWYKLVVAQGDLLLYPDEYDGDSIWRVVRWRLLDAESADSRFIQVRKLNGEDIPYYLDVDHGDIFEETDFPLAYDRFNKLTNEQFADD